MMAVFYYGTGGADIVKTTLFIKISGGKSWERSFSNHSPKMCKLIISVVNGAMSKSLEGEILAIIEKKMLENKYNADEIKRQHEPSSAGTTITYLI